MDLTDKFFAILASALLLFTLLFFAEQEIKLHSELVTANKKLDAEIQCSVGSTCAQRLNAAAATAENLVDKAKAAGEAQLAAEKAALEKQAADTVAAIETQQKAQQLGATNWKKKYQELLSTPSCEAWAKTAVQCDVH